MEVLLAYNASAGDDGDEDVQKAAAGLRRAGYDVALQSVKDEHWERALRRPFEVVVAAGGDGTVGAVFKQLAGTSQPVMVVAIGSANNIARSLPRARSGRTSFDICSLTSEGETARFVESCGGGVFADMVKEAESDSGVDDKVERGLRTLLKVATSAPARVWRVDADGRDLSGEYIAVEVLNIPFLGPNVPLAPSADPGDGLLDVVLVGPNDAASLRDYARARLEQAPVTELSLETHRARSVTVQPPSDALIRLDDEVLESVDGTLVATVETGVEVWHLPR